MFLCLVRFLRAPNGTEHRARITDVIARVLHLLFPDKYKISPDPCSLSLSLSLSLRLSFSFYLCASLRLAINQKFPNDVARLKFAAGPRATTTAKAFDLCYRQREINFAIVVRTYVSQRGFICGYNDVDVSLSLPRLAGVSINIATVIHGACQTHVHVTPACTLPWRLNAVLFYIEIIASCALDRSLSLSLSLSTAAKQQLCEDAE